VTDLNESQYGTNTSEVNPLRSSLGVQQRKNLLFQKRAGGSLISSYQSHAGCRIPLKEKQTKPQGPSSQYQVPNKVDQIQLYHGQAFDDTISSKKLENQSILKKFDMELVSGMRPKTMFNKEIKGSTKKLTSIKTSDWITAKSPNAKIKP